MTSQTKLIDDTVEQINRTKTDVEYLIRLGIVGYDALIKLQAGLNEVPRLIQALEEIKNLTTEAENAQETTKQTLKELQKDIDEIIKVLNEEKSNFENLLLEEDIEIKIDRDIETFVMSMKAVLSNMMNIVDGGTDAITPNKNDLENAKKSISEGITKIEEEMNPEKSVARKQYIAMRKIINNEIQLDEAIEQAKKVAEGIASDTRSKAYKKALEIKEFVENGLADFTDSNSRLRLAIRDIGTLMQGRNKLESESLKPNVTETKNFIKNLDFDEKNLNKIKEKIQGIIVAVERIERNCKDIANGDRAIISQIKGALKTFNGAIKNIVALDKLLKDVKKKMGDNGNSFIRFLRE